MHCGHVSMSRLQPDYTSILYTLYHYTFVYINIIYYNHGKLSPVTNAILHLSLEYIHVGRRNIEYRQNMAIMHCSD